ncbi:hypothetical protein ABPG75_003078 [Micractinium tetrahymenae]
MPFRPAAAPQRTLPTRTLLVQPRQRRRRVALACAASASAAAVVDVETARKLLDGLTMVVDIRPEREYEEGRITKPARRTVSVPYAAGSDAAAFVARVAAKFPSRAAELIVMCGDGGRDSAEAAATLANAGYTEVLQMEGGYAGYSAVWSPSGKRRPPAGRWVSTGKEALKSGLNIPGVAESYDEGGNLAQARWAEGLSSGEELPRS